MNLDTLWEEHLDDISGVNKKAPKKVAAFDDRRICSNCSGDLKKPVKGQFIGGCHYEYEYEGTF